MANLEKIETHLETHGWTRKVAGDRDFTAALLALGTAVDNGLGLIVSGNPGCGKTTLVEAIAPAFGHFRRINCNDREDVLKLTPSWQELWAENLQEENVFLDDIGTDRPVYLDYVKTELVGDFLMKRADLYEYGPVRNGPDSRPAPLFFGTTNFDSKQFDERYDGRIYSRLKHIAVPLHLTGDDKREWIKPILK